MINAKLNRREGHAFTLLELLVVVVVSAVMFGLLVPWSQGTKSHALTTMCAANLKQVALGQILWANDHFGSNFTLLPAGIPAKDGGLMEVATVRKDAVALYVALSNEIYSPKILACPAERKVVPAEDFKSLTAAGISYFLNVDATVLFPESALQGDAKLSVLLNKPSKLITLSNDSKIEWDGRVHEGVGKGVGNIALADGSVYRARLTELRGAFTNAAGGTITARLLIP